MRVMQGDGGRKPSSHRNLLFLLSPRFHMISILSLVFLGTFVCLRVCAHRLAPTHKRLFHLLCCFCLSFHSCVSHVEMNCDRVHSSTTRHFTTGHRSRHIWSLDFITHCLHTHITVLSLCTLFFHGERQLCDPHMVFVFCVSAVVRLSL